MLNIGHGMQLCWTITEKKDYGQKHIFLTCPKVANRARRERLGGRHTFRPLSWQQRFGKQSRVFLQGLGNKSNTGGGGGVHWR